MPSELVMHLELYRTCRLPRPPLWGVAWALASVAMVAAVHGAQAFTGREARVCAIKNLTGVPCPTCGSTRGGMCLLHGKPVDAWRWNPLVMTALAGLTVAAAVRLLFGRAVRVSLSSREKTVAMVLLALAVLANWAYVIRAGN